MASMKVDEWDRMVDVNIKGVLHGIAAVLPEMTSRSSATSSISPPSGRCRWCRPPPSTAPRNSPSGRFRTDATQERPDLRVTCIHPGVVESELAETITDPAAAEAMKTYRAIALKPDAIGRAVRFAIEQPDDDRSERDRCSPNGCCLREENR